LSVSDLFSQHPVVVSTSVVGIITMAVRISSVRQESDLEVSLAHDMSG
jgi:hypothetical protein